MGRAVRGGVLTGTGKARAAGVTSGTWNARGMTRIARGIRGASGARGTG